MPLPAEVQTLPLLAIEWFNSNDPVESWLEWLPVARMGTTIFWWLLLWASWRLAWIYGGTLAGHLSVALVACEPILLGHASLATTDIPFTACLLALVAVFRKRREKLYWLDRLLLPSFWFMLTFTAKSSALVFVPVCLTMVEIERLWSLGWRPAPQDGSWMRAWASLRDLMGIGVMGLALLFIVCPQAWVGLSYQIRHNIQGHGGSFLLGDWNVNGFWYYFPAALMIKVALPVFLLLGHMLVVRPHYLINGAVWAALGLLVLTPAFRVQLGVRFVLPIVTLVAIGAAIAASRWWAEPLTILRRVLGGSFVCGLVLWSLISACLVWPHGICYTNEVFGGTKAGYLVLSDSNYDWGQGIPELLEWHRKHSDVSLFLWYFGADSSAAREPFRSVDAAMFRNADELIRMCHGGYLAASTSQIYGKGFATPAAKYLRALQPFAHTTTYLIYDFTKKK